MAKVTLDPIGSFSQSAITTINTNMDRVEAAIEKTLSRDGTLPNQMEADLDLNANSIINAGSVSTETLFVDGTEITADGVVGAPGPEGPPGADGVGIPAGGSTGQVLAKASATDYDTEWVATGGGSVDSVNGQTGVVVLNADHIDDTSTTNKFATASELSKLAGIEPAADVTDAVNVGSSIDGATAKVTPVDADTIPLIDSAASNVLKKVTWANVKATLKTYFDTLYQPVLATLTSWGAITRAAGFDTFVATPSWTNFLALVTGEPTFYTSGGTDVSVADGGTGRSTSTTAYGLIAAGTTATGAHQTLAAGATTEILVGGGASALPVWTTATGSGAPVRATSPSLVTPVLGTPSSGTLTSCTGLPIVAGTTGTLTETRGGTNQTTYATGDILYASAANTLSKLAAGTAGYTLQTNGAAAPTWVIKREVLTAARTYYVRSDGSNSNTGLVNSSGGAFLTLQKAWDVLVTLDLNGFDVTIKIGHTATLTAGINATVGPIGGNVIIEGDVATPANTIISVTSNDCIRIACVANVTVQSLELRTTTSGYGVAANQSGAKITIGTGVRFGACAFGHIRALSGGYVVPGTYTITGSSLSHLDINIGGMVEMSGNTITLTGTPAFTNGFAVLAACSVYSAFSVTFSGSGTGPRYSVSSNSVLNTFGAGASALPGNSAGSTATGGQYL